MKREFAMYSRVDIILENGKFVKLPRPAKRVRVMSRAEGWSMVRYPGCIPFVVRDSELASPPSGDGKP